MKTILSVVAGVAMALTLAGCARDASFMKFAQSGVDPEALLNDHLYDVRHNRVKPYHEEWKNVKCEIAQPQSPKDTYKATITAEVYEFNSATATEPVMRTNLALKLAYESRRWVLKEVKEDSGIMLAGQWTMKGDMHPVKERGVRWKVVERELGLK